MELFFKWIKSHLRIKRFFGTTANAVKTQIWIAVSIYVLVAIVRKQLAPNRSLYTLLQILSLSLFASRLQCAKQPKRQPTATIQLMMGQQWCNAVPKFERTYSAHTKTWPQKSQTKNLFSPSHKTLENFTTNYFCGITSMALHMRAVGSIPAGCLKYRSKKPSLTRMLSF